MPTLEFNSRKIALETAKKIRNDGKWKKVKVVKRGTKKDGYFYQLIATGRKRRG